jgi:hypothetical protein
MEYDYDLLFKSELSVLEKMGIKDNETRNLLAEHTLMLEGQIADTTAELIKAKRIICKLLKRK